MRHNGTVLLDDVGDYIKQALAGQYVDVCVDADQQACVIWHQHQPYKRVAITGLPHAALSFERFVELMSQQAHSEQRRMAQAHRKVD